ncbi:basic amino acid/polyamine antiporter, APA family [Parapedobacter composti]|uniref:Basic amino acid/polyamine antiporter, APA family n=1 Tax=Parapedobacter composti TaxID=623281 RepID=A0A1I1L1V6_9SPHI|nr:amino acid permease [Parapedobacter composti]SFC66915.1 basic amino acid/polyamine antiporter, APA family [Parapedobacter composti]
MNGSAKTTIEGQQSLKRTLGLFDSTMLVAGSMIGSGIFIVSAEVMRDVGGAGYMMLLWGMAGVITLIAALSYGELAAMMPKAGGQYIYLRESYNRMTGFLYGWTIFFVVQTGVAAAVAIAFARFTGVLVPWVSPSNVLFSVGFNITSQDLLAVSVVVFLTWVNLQGVKSGKLVQGVFTVAKIWALLAIIVVGVWAGYGSGYWPLNMEHAWDAFRTTTRAGHTEGVFMEPLKGWQLLGVLGCALVGPLFASEAWNNITYTAGEVINPRKNIPLSLFLGTLTVTVLYLLVNVAYLMLLPAQGNPDAPDVIGRGIMFAADDRVGTAAFATVFGDAAVAVIAVLIMVSTFGACNALILAGARLYYAMAKDGLFLSRAGQINDRGVPGFALVAQCVWTCLLCLTGTYSALIAYAIFAQLIFYILTVGGVLLLRRKKPHEYRPYKAFGYPVLPVVYMLLAAGICVSLLIYRPATSWPGVVIVLLGAPVYVWINRKNVNLQKPK